MSKRGHHEGAVYDCTHIKGCTNGTSNTNQLNVSRFELSVRVIALRALREGCTKTVMVRGDVGAVFIVDALLLIVVRRVHRRRRMDAARSHLDRRISANFRFSDVDELWKAIQAIVENWQRDVEKLQLGVEHSQRIDLRRREKNSTMNSMCRTRLSKNRSIAFQPETKLTR